MRMKESPASSKNNNFQNPWPEIKRTCSAVRFSAKFFMTFFRVEKRKIFIYFVTSEPGMRVKECSMFKLQVLSTYYLLLTLTVAVTVLHDFFLFWTLSKLKAQRNAFFSPKKILKSPFLMLITDLPYYYNQLPGAYNYNLILI